MWLISLHFFCLVTVIPVSLQLLLSNDDGVDAEGLAALRDAALAVGRPIVVAPDRCHSGAGHQVTTHRPLRISKLADDRFTTDGSPADCIRLGLDRIAPATDCVLAGINHGGNLGIDLYMSGTAAAVREGVVHGKRGIAVSHYHRKGVDPLDWPRATRWLIPILQELLQRPWVAGTFWNVNLPHLAADAPDPEILECAVDPSPLPVRYATTGEVLNYAGNYHERPRRPGTDVDVCFSGKISISLVSLF
jgi:5'-nucleotidase